MHELVRLTFMKNNSSNQIKSNPFAVSLNKMYIQTKVRNANAKAIIKIKCIKKYESKNKHAQKIEKHHSKRRSFQRQKK